MDTPIPPEIPQPSGNDRIWSMLSHLSCLFGLGLILPLVVYLAMRRESAFVAGNARAALNFHISIIIYALCCIPLTFVIVGIPLLVALGITTLVLSIIAAVKASDGKCYHYPLAIPLIG